MADTPRSLAALQALLADNIAGDISPQDLRDFLVSSLGEYAEIYVHDGAAAQAGITLAPVLMTGFAADGAESGSLDADVANDRINVDESIDALVTFQCSFFGDVNTTWQFHLRVAGVEQVQAACQRKLGAGGDVGSCSFTAIVAGLINTDVLEVYVESDQAGGASFTPVHAQLVARRIK